MARHDIALSTTRDTVGRRAATLIDVHLPSHPGYYGEMVWVLMMLEQWLQTHER